MNSYNKIDTCDTIILLSANKGSSFGFLESVCPGEVSYVELYKKENNIKNII